ncbi:MAG TPA: tyrosine-type recombinase/integrase [Emticicia sp.]
MFLERFSQYLKFEKRFSPHTVSAYQRDLIQFFDFIGSRELEFSEINHTHVRSFIIDMMETGLDPRSVNRKISTLRSFYKFLLRDGSVSSNPMTHVKATKTSRRLPVVVEETKLNVLLDSDNIFSDNFIGLRDRLVMEILFGTGIRVAELLALKDYDVDHWNKTIRVFGKRSKERLIPLNASLFDLIETYKVEKKKTFLEGKEQLVVTEKGEKAYPGLIQKIVHKYLSYISTQSKKSPHVLRHTFATTLLNKGADLNAIKELLGHSSLAATQVYTHNSVEKLKSIYKQAHPKA